MSGTDKRLKLEPAVAELQTEIRRAVATASFGLQAAATATITNLEVPGTFGGAGLGEVKFDLAELRKGFSIALLLNCFRDCVDAVHATLIWVRHHCYLATHPSTVPRPLSSQWHARYCHGWALQSLRETYLATRHGPIAHFPRISGPKG